MSKLQNQREGFFKFGTEKLRAGASGPRELAGKGTEEPVIHF